MVVRSEDVGLFCPDNGLHKSAGENAPLTEKGDFQGRPHLSTHLLILRNRVGADTPIGHGCSNLNEQLLELPNYVRPAWATHPKQTLQAAIAWQVERLARLTAKEG